MAATVAAARDPELAGALAEALDAHASARAPRTTPRREAVRRGAGDRPAAAPRCSPGGPTSTSRRCSAAAPDVGEAGAQVDAVLADHRRLTEGTA